LADLEILLFRWIATALVHAAIIFVITYGIFVKEILWSDGTNSGGFIFGAAAYTYVIVVVCLKAGIEMSSWTLLSHIGIWGSMLSWFIYQSTPISGRICLISVKTLSEWSEPSLGPGCSGWVC
jgi:Phospholipid-translocating P-type ATPase C-terminal